MLPDSTFVYVTHNTREALFLADRIAIMQDGRILQTAPKDFLIEHFEYLEGMQILAAAENLFDVEFDGERLTFNGEPFDDEPKHIDYSRLKEGQVLTGATNALSDVPQIFDKNGKNIAISSSELRLDGSLKGDVLSFADKEICLTEDYLSRLIRQEENISVVMEIDKFSKSIVNNGFSLTFEVLENCGSYTVLKLFEKSFILNKRTALLVGEKIRLYYKMDDLIIFSGNERLTCHYPLHKSVPIKIFDAQSGKFELLGKRIKLGRQIESRSSHAVLNNGFELSYDKGRCALRVEGCLDEEFINGKKLCHIKIQGEGGYFSVFCNEKISCFSKNKVWLNIYPNKLEFEERNI
jgi:hypothetical protein